MSPRVVADASSWPPANVAPPKLTGTAGAELTQFAAFRNAASTLTFGCVATPIPGWVEDMRPSVEGRTVALAGASAALAAGHPIDARSNGRGGFDLRDVRELGKDPPPIGNAKTFLGFDAHRVHTCFATCIGADCASVVDGAHLEGSDAPPPPGIALASATWAVHHPRPFATGGAVTLVLLGAALVITRRKPRHAAGSRR
jgi:hypothetical protein